MRDVRRLDMGRPKKNIAADSSILSASAAPKKRGRPRKIADPVSPTPSVEENFIDHKAIAPVVVDRPHAAVLRSLVKTFYDIQDVRKRTEARLRLKADGTAMKDNGTVMASTADGLKFLRKNLEKLQEMEKEIGRDIEKMYKKCPEYEYLKTVKGVGPTIGAILISEIDIGKATTVSKIWQYAGLNPGNVKGKKAKKNSDGSYNIITTDEYVKGDRLSAGFVSPYNKFLKTKLLGVLADCMMKSRSPWMDFYYNYKNRLANSTGFRKGSSLDNPKSWSEEAPMHRERAARRYMIKMFLIDYYVNIRTLYGLEVRPPYQEEKLGHLHNGTGVQAPIVKPLIKETIEEAPVKRKRGRPRKNPL